MISIWNRRELIVTMEMKRQSEIRDILSQNKIDYIIKTKNYSNHLNRPYPYKI